MVAARQSVLSKTWRLVIPQRIWEAVWRGIGVQAHRCAVSPLRWQNSQRTISLIAEDAAMADSLPRGSDRLAADDWLMIYPCEDVRDPDTMRSMVHTIQPGPSQTLVLLLVDATKHASWNAGCVHQRELFALDQVQCVGSGMLRLGAASEHSSTNSKRWSRTRGALGTPVLHKIRTADVTLVGAGRNGSAAAFQLASLGVRRLRLIDGDRLKLENMDAMVGLNFSDVGSRKVSALARRLQAFRPDLALTVLKNSVTTAAAQAILQEPADLIVTCVDNDAARLSVAMAARQSCTLHLDIGTNVARDDERHSALFGDARILLPGEGCVACVGPMPDLERRRFELNMRSDHLHHQLGPTWNMQRAGSLVTFNAMTVAAGVQLWIELLAGHLRGSHWQRFDWDSETGLDARSAAVSADKDCEICWRWRDS
ncbi:MAG: ThiF family adenylyltransferase [Planctomycetota bacterium]